MKLRIEFEGRTLELNVKPDFHEDYLLALRCAYYCHSKSLVPDTEYDRMEREYLKTASKQSLLQKTGSDNLADYPARVRALCMYLIFSLPKARRIENRRFKK